MADVCSSHDNRLTEAAPWHATDAAAGARVTSARSTTATVGARCLSAQVAEER